jgi:hypothetical protein
MIALSKEITMSRGSRYFDIYRVDAVSLKTEAVPVFSISARDTLDARAKANRQLLREGRNKGFDLAWTDARQIP